VLEAAEAGIQFPGFFCFAFDLSVAHLPVFCILFLSHRMRESDIYAHIHFQHSSNEVAGLNEAIAPMMDNIRAVSTQAQRARMRTILAGGYFRAMHARAMISMLLRATKYARANLADYFPMMRAGVLEQAQALEDAVTNYRVTFEALKQRTLPTH
jgi:hypothetical protein